MKQHYSLPGRTSASTSIKIASVVWLFFCGIIGQAQTNIKVVPAGKNHTVSVQYNKDVFYLLPSVVADELAWLDKFNGNKTYADQVQYLRYNPQAIQFTEAQKEFRNVTEEKLYKSVLSILPRLIVEGKASHFDKILHKPSTVLIITYCDDKSPSYVGVSTQKGRIIMDCVSK